MAALYYLSFCRSEFDTDWKVAKWLKIYGWIKRSKKKNEDIAFKFLERRICYESEKFFDA